MNLQDSLSRGDADIYQRKSCELVAIPDQRSRYAVNIYFSLSDLTSKSKTLYEKILQFKFQF